MHKHSYINEWFENIYLVLVNQLEVITFLVDDVIFGGENITEKTKRKKSGFQSVQVWSRSVSILKSKNGNFWFGLGHTEDVAEPVSPLVILYMVQVHNCNIRV